MSNSQNTQNVKILGPYDLHVQSNICCSPAEDKTKQAFGEECNINNIMAKYAKTGIIESGNSIPASYGDASAFDFQKAQNLIIQANDLFNALPAKVRSKFDNDPHTMLNWMDNPENHQEARSLGLLATPIVLPPTDTTSPTVVAPMPHQTSTKGAGAPIPPA